MTQSQISRKRSVSSFTRLFFLKKIKWGCLIHVPCAKNLSYSIYHRTWTWFWHVICACTDALLSSWIKPSFAGVSFTWITLLSFHQHHPTEAFNLPPVRTPIIIAPKWSFRFDATKLPKEKPKETRLLRELWWWHVMVDSIDDKLNPWTALADGGAYWDFITFCLQWCVWMVSISNADVFHIGAGTPLCAITPIHESDAKCCQFSPDLVRASIILCFSCSSSLLQLGCQICFC